jgi:predicted AlkP superfamily phosphohydrolase/phosphomutase
MGNNRLLIIGLDCATPQLVFEAWREELPNISKLAQEGIWGELESTVPPITVPAWTCMMTGKDPGELGFYGFRNRSDYSYKEMGFATSASVKEPAVWQLLSQAGKKVVIVGVPQTYPPKPVNGQMITCFLTPSTESQYTYPAELKQEIEGLVGKYMLDVEDFRTNDKDELLKRIYAMTTQRFEVVRHMMTTKPWDFLMFVEMGIDRIHHAFWKYSDLTHSKFEPGNPYEFAIRDYYKFIDQQIGTLLELVDSDTTVAIVSDHGAKKMDGGICINEWLMQEGYLKLKSYPDKITPFEKCEIDWENTMAWGAGGYYGRLFLNVRGREAQGCVAPADYEMVRSEIARKLEAIVDPEGNNIGTKAYRAQDVYREVKGIPPDLIVYFGDLFWRSVGSIGHKSMYTFDNDTGPDDANHAQHGIFVMKSPQNGSKQGWLEGLQLMDMAPTSLRLLGVDVPSGMHGKNILE